MTSKRRLKARLDALEEATTTDDDRLEVLFDPGLRMAPEPQLTERFVASGFVVERDERVFETGYEDVFLHTTPSNTEVLPSLQWHYPGPTAPRTDVRIDWDEGPREAALAAADHPVRWTKPDLPADPAVVASGEGWEAVVPADRCLESLVMRRGTAERAPYEICGLVEVPLDGAEGYDLVTVAAPPDADRHPHIDVETH